MAENTFTAGPFMSPCHCPPLNRENMCATFRYVHKSRARNPQNCHLFLVNTKARSPKSNAGNRYRSCCFTAKQNTNVIRNVGAANTTSFRLDKNRHPHNATAASGAATVSTVDMGPSGRHCQFIPNKHHML